MPARSPGRSPVPDPSEPATRTRDPRLRSPQRLADHVRHPAIRDALVTREREVPGLRDAVRRAVRSSRRRRSCRPAEGRRPPPCPIRPCRSSPLRRGTTCRASPSGRSARSRSWSRCPKPRSDSHRDKFSVRLADEVVHAAGRDRDSVSGDAERPVEGAAGRVGRTRPTVPADDHLAVGLRDDSAPGPAVLPAR